MKNQEFWIINRHCSNMKLLVEIAKYLLEKQGNSINKEGFQNILENLKEKEIYKPRNENILSTLLIKIS